MSALTHLGVHLMNNKAVQTVAAGAAVGPAAVATGSALTAVGATGVGTAITSTGCSLLAGAATTLGGERQSLVELQCLLVRLQ